MIVPLVPTCIVIFYIMNNQPVFANEKLQLLITSADERLGLTHYDLDLSGTSQSKLPEIHPTSGNSSNSLEYKNKTDDIFPPDNRVFYFNSTNFDRDIIEGGEMLQTINDLEYPSGENWQPRGNASSFEIVNFFETTGQTNYNGWLVNSTIHLTESEGQPLKSFHGLTADKYTELKTLQLLIISPRYFNSSYRWNTAWHSHAYLFGSLFFLLLICSIFNVARILKSARKLNRRYFLFLNAFVIIASLTRSIYLLIDPYNYDNSYPDILNYFLFKTIYPCLSSAFGLIFIILSQSTRMKFLKPVVVITISSFYLIFSIISDILVGWFGRSVVLIMISQLTFIAWMSFLSSCYFYNYQTFLSTASIKHNELLRMTFSRRNNNIRQNVPKIAYCLIIKVALVASVVGLLLSVSHLCGVIFCLTAPDYITPWLWWCYQTLCRLLELIMSFTICVLAGNTKHLSFRGENLTHSFCSLMCWCRYRTTLRNQRKNDVKISFRTHNQILKQTPSSITRCELTERPNSLFTVQGYNRNHITTITEETDNTEAVNRILYISKLNEFVCFPADKPSSNSDNSVLANAGSKIPSVTDEESPYFRRALHLKKWSPCSSADVSSDQMTPARITGDETKHGSSCSSESAGNSFDVALFRSNAFWFWSREPNVRRCGYATVGSPFRLELFKNTVNVACGTDDISPDSAINVDVQTEPESPVIKQSSSDCTLDLEVREEFADYGKTVLRRALSERQNSAERCAFKHGGDDV